MCWFYYTSHYSPLPFMYTLGAINIVRCYHHLTVPPPPKNVLASKVNFTAIDVSWDKQTLVELKGLADYIVEYSPVDVLKSKRQIGNTVTVYMYCACLQS